MDDLDRDLLSYRERYKMLKDRIDLITKESNHMIILGSRGAGKTSLGNYLLELHKGANRKCYVLNHPKPKLLPKWIHNITKMEHLPENAVCLIDEPEEFNQYSYQKRDNLYLKGIMTKARHKKQSFIFIALTTNFINKNFLYMINLWFFKKPTLFQREEERKIVRQSYSRIQEEIGTDEFYYMDDFEWAKGRFKIPEWYTEKLSKAYSGVDAEEI
jgi:energy-coupling factor transporter ATP-binding protein EcfA2